MTRAMEYGWPGGDRVGDISFKHPVNREISDKIIACVHSTLECTCPIMGLHPSKEAAGSYKLGDKFIRVSSRCEGFDLEKDILRYLKEDGVPVNEIFAGNFIFEWKGVDYRVDIRPFLQGHHFQGDNEELALLSKTLRILHHSLMNFTREDEVQSNQKALALHQDDIVQLTNSSLKNNDYGMFYERAPWIQKRKEWLLEVINDYSPHFQERDLAQCIHGQVHPGNVIFNNEKATLLDLETAARIYAPPSWDLAYFVQRFCMYDGTSPSMLANRLEVVQEGYGEKLPPLTRIMRDASIFSIISAIGYRLKDGVLVPESEFEKFHHMERQALSMESVLG